MENYYYFNHLDFFTFLLFECSKLSRFMKVEGSGTGETIPDTLYLNYYKEIPTINKIGNYML